MSEATPLIESQALPERKGYLTVGEHRYELNSPTEDVATYQASVFVEDAIYYRSIHHKITPRALKVYSFYHHWIVQFLVTLTIFVLLLLAFFEYPTSINLSADFRYNNSTPHIAQPPCGSTELVELLCLVLLLAGLFVRIYVIGFRRFVGEKWLLLYAFIILVSFVDLAVSFSFCLRFGQGSVGSTIRVRRFARPLFLVISSTYVKKFLKAAARTMKHVISILVLLVLHIFVFAMIGQLVYARPLPTIPSSENNFSNASTISDVDSQHFDTHNYSHFVHLEGKKYFNSVEDSLVSLIVFLTTSNNPDIMTPIYQYDRLSFLYFFVFLSIGLYLILNLLTAAIYTEFRGYLEQSLRGSFLRRQAALKAAFVILDRESGGNGASKQLVFRVLQGMKNQRRRAPEVYVQLCTTTNATSEHINWRKFQHLFNSVIRDRRASQVISTDTCSPTRVVHCIQKVVHHRSFTYLSMILMLVHVGVITLEMEFDYVKVIRHCNSVLAYANLFFVLYYTVEQVVKIVGLGNTGCNFDVPAKRFVLCAYLRSFDRAYEFFITLMIVLTEVVILIEFGIRSNDPQTEFYASCIRFMNLLVLLRLLGIISMIPHISRVFSMMVEILRNLRPFATVIMTVYYLYALLGMEIFGRNYRLDNVTSARNNVCGTYEQQQYFSYNFHDFAASLVLLWNLMVVNNWFVFKDAFVYATNSKWSQIYFISWWLVSVVITLNLFISLVIEIFVTQWEKEKEQFVNRGDDGTIRGREEADVRQGNYDSSPQINDSDNLFLMLHHSFKEPTEAELGLEVSKHADLS